MLAGLVASVVLPGCGNLGSHSLNLRLQVRLDSTALYISNPTQATYFRTQVEVNDTFAAAVGTIRPGGQYRLLLDSLRSEQGKRLRGQLHRVTCYAQDSVGNYDALILDPVPISR